MDKVEQARKLFQKLEASGVGQNHAAKIARRAFFVEDSLSAIRG